MALVASRVRDTTPGVAYVPTTWKVLRMSLIVAIGPALTSIAALVQLSTVRRRPVFAFAVGLAIQPVWVAFSFATHDYGFLIATAAFVGVNAWQLFRALRERAAIRRQEDAYLAFFTRMDGPPRVLPNLRALFLKPSPFQTACTRGALHGGPCNGLPGMTCPVYTCDVRDGDYGVCNLKRGHDGNWHREMRDGKVWAEWATYEARTRSGQQRGAAPLTP